jgi:hypothetical protein
MSKLDKIFDADNTETTEVVKYQKPEPPVKSDKDIIGEILEKDLLQDYRASREDYDELMGKGKDFLDKIMEMAEMTQNPRFYEAAAELLKNLSDANSNRLDVHGKLVDTIRKKSEIGMKNLVKGGGGNETKIIFVGTSAELQKKVKPRIIDVTPEEE